MTNIRLCLLLGTLTLVAGANLAAFQPEAPDKDAADGKADIERFVPPAIPFIPPVDEQVLAVAFSPDGKKLVTCRALAGSSRASSRSGT